MEKLRLGASASQKGEVLSRSQLKKVLGGDGSSGSGAAGNGEDYLYCTTTTGYECWYAPSRKSLSALSACGDIYPGGNIVSAHWGNMGGGCHMG